MIKKAPATWELAEKFTHANSLKEISGLTSAAARNLGFEHHGFAMRGPVLGYNFFHNIPEPWGNVRYLETYGTAAEEKDPLIQGVMAGAPPTAFGAKGGASNWGAGYVQRSQKLLRQAQDYGVKAGIIAPVYGAGLAWAFLVFTTGDTDNMKDLLPALADVSLLSSFVLCSSRALLVKEKDSPALTLREQEILKWTHAGKTSWEIGKILGISEKAADYHALRASKKLKVSGRRAAVYQALALGLIKI